MVEKIRQQEVSSREDTPTELSIYTYADLSYRRINPVVDRSCKNDQTAVSLVETLVNPYCQERQEVAVDEAMSRADGEEVYIWTAVDYTTLEVSHVDALSCRSDLNALVSLERTPESLPRSAHTSD